MAVKVYLGFEPRTTWDIPRPPRPDNDDVDPSSYIPKGMTSADRSALREAGLEWTDSLGAVKGGAVGWAAKVNDRRKGGSGQNRFARASENVFHFRHGGGAPLQLSESEVSDLQSQTTLFSGVERQFIDLIEGDMRGRAEKTRMHFLAMNGNKDSPNAGTAWFGANAKVGTGWFYAVGGFLLGFGAMAVRRKDFVAIWYRCYVYDRYNWDLGKETPVPAGQMSYLLNDSVMEQIAGMTAPDSMRYFRSVAPLIGPDGKPVIVDDQPVIVNQDTKDRDGNVNGYEIGEAYVAADALLGALEESGDAQRYDINGTGRIVYVSIPIEAGK